MSTQDLLSPEVKREIDHWLTKYPTDQRRSAVVPTMRLVQHHNGGWLSEQLLDAIADYIQIPRIEVYEVATFYDMISLKPMGKHQIDVCTNVSCSLRGADKILQAIRDRLGIGPGETTPDGKFTIKEVECMAACGGAPMCQVDHRAYHENLTPEKITALLDQLAQENDHDA